MYFEVPGYDEDTVDRKLWGESSKNNSKKSRTFIVEFFKETTYRDDTSNNAKNREWVYFQMCIAHP
jgi:hypothetical protein